MLGKFGGEVAGQAAFFGPIVEYYRQDEAFLAKMDKIKEEVFAPGDPRAERAMDVRFGQIEAIPAQRTAKLARKIKSARESILAESGIAGLKGAALAETEDALQAAE